MRLRSKKIAIDQLRGDVSWKDGADGAGQNVASNSNDMCFRPDGTVDTGSVSASRTDKSIGARRRGQHRQ